MLKALAAKIDQQMRSVLPPAGGECVFLDYPSQANVGDSLIWLGTLKCLQDLGLKVTYVADFDTYDETHLRRVLGQNTTIILQGGGNFGDLYPKNQLFVGR